MYRSGREVSPAGLIVAAICVAILGGAIGATLMSASVGDSFCIPDAYTSCASTAWTSSGEHWWGLAISAVSSVVASSLLLVALIAKGVQLGNRISR